ncbi:hypothetical protein [Pricia sp.]|uniref:hypothetical protein n=1 Tax=Pricia sp. TaxID=2268138 RepID=UPI00359378FF
MKDWIKDTKDLGEYPEKELIDHWLVDGGQPQLPPLEMEDKNDSIHLISKKSDATIVWKQAQDSAWTVDGEPLPTTISFEAKAERIGYSDSAVSRFE